MPDVGNRLERLHEALETKHLTLESLSPRIPSLRARQGQLSAAREEEAKRLRQLKVALPTSGDIKGYVDDFRSFFGEEPRERKASFAMSTRVSRSRASKPR